MVAGGNALRAGGRTGGWRKEGSQERDGVEVGCVYPSICYSKVERHDFGLIFEKSKCPYPSSYDLSR